MSDPVDETFTALADPTRRAIVGLLRKRPWRSSELADELSTTRPAMSRHLRVLRKARIVGEHGLEEDARAKVYELRRESFTALRGWLDEVEAFWEEQLGAFAAHAERRRRGRR